MPTVLAIDDQRDNIVTIEAMLKNLMPEAQVVTALSGQEGLEKAEEHRPDVILLDIRMPKMDGFDVCRRLKTSDATRHIPVIMLTAVMRDSDSKIKGLEAGADSYLTKPIDGGELLAQVRVALRIKEAEDRLRQEKERVAERAAKDIKRERAFFSHLFDASPAAISLFTPGGTIENVNDAFETLFDCRRSEIVGAVFRERFVPEDRIEESRLLREGMKGGKAVTEETVRQTAKGRKIDLSFIGIPVIIDGSVEAIFTIYQDITERKAQERKLSASLKEKDLLLREIHHRVKNNLQIISSLLSLQARKLLDEKAIVAMEEMKERILSMSTIHDKLYHSDDMSRVDFAEYVETRCREALRSCRMTGQEITLETHLAPLSLGIDRAVPCGLIVNEVIGNALKHAFTDGREGRIEITLCKNAGGTATLCLRDDGIGIPDDIDMAEANTFGLRLIGMLARQLDGTVTVERTGGTTVKVIFPLEHKDDTHQRTPQRGQ